MTEMDELIQRLGAAADEWWRGSRERTAQLSDPLVNRYRSTLDRLYALGWDDVLGWRIELPDEVLPERYLRRRTRVLETLEDELAYLAMDYRASSDAAQEARILAAYERTMTELFRIGHWSGEPDPESQLPRDLMPQVYKEYWKKRVQGEASPVKGGV